MSTPWRRLTSSQFRRYLIVGGLNTAWGYGLIFSFMHFLRWSPIASNIAGYGAGLISSYLFNRVFTFTSPSPKGAEFARFVVVFLTAFSTNLLVLTILVRVLLVNVVLSQAVAVCIYVCVSFQMQRRFVFPKRLPAKPA